MADIFISYANVDRERARELADRLASQGHTVWWDRTIPPGRVFDEVIQEALHAARCVIVLWSAQSVRSNWVKTEAAEGMSAKRLLPVFIERVSPPIEFKRIQAADLSDWRGDDDHPEYGKLLASVNDMLERGPVSQAVLSPSFSPDAPAYRTTRSGSRNGWLAAGLAVLVAATGAAYLLGKGANQQAPLADPGFSRPAESASATGVSEPVAQRPSGGTAAPATAPTGTGRINLLSAENGGEIVTAPNEGWVAAVDGRDETGAWVNNGQAVFAFKDGRAATFDTFAVLIPGTADYHLAEFELLAGNDGPNGNFTSLGTFKTQNVRIMKQPYQEFQFAPSRARFFKFRSVKAHNSASGAVLAHEFQLLGRLD